MGLFHKTAQRITISSETQDSLTAFAAHISARKLKDTKVSSVKHVDGEWQCVINCKQAEAIYYQEILPLLYDSVETQSFRIMLELDNKSEPARRCPREILVSFDLKSQFAFGDKADHEFIQKLHTDIVQGAIKPATVSYYIVGGGAVTMSIPCLDLQKMDMYIQREFKNYGIKRFMVNIVEREH